MTTTVELTEEEMRAIETLAQLWGISKSATIRVLLTYALLQILPPHYYNNINIVIN